MFPPADRLAKDVPDAAFSALQHNPKELTPNATIDTPSVPTSTFRSQPARTDAHLQGQFLDHPEEGAAHAIAKLKRLGLSVHLLTDDNRMWPGMSQHRSACVPERIVDGEGIGLLDAIGMTIALSASSPLPCRPLSTRFTTDGPETSPVSLGSP